MQDVFVFGSNLAGRHGKGAALFAAKHYGAERGCGEGMTGSAYAIPTKGRNLEALPLDAVSESIVKFIRFAETHPELRFYLTPIGCGLAGHKKKDIWAILKSTGLPSNVFLTSTWVTD